ncbi:hypothetical protein [Hymenobacter cellulosivorans]|uniref:Uncharacterized protein n=1 Tax=Hymenobacter cellulosivorans TaxID=2932249 RepID=A0ABY4FCA2_9BACT|nr:hypothetical protein [Hymenobacter cellulosivorans]UOQ53579.1 hypothetical protein MUN80_02200 [Hymenobacter cellulosivorans]
MSVFAHIDERLEQFAAAQHTVLTRNRKGFSDFEERRIDWQRDGFNLAVIIQPTFELKGVDTSKWNVRVVAWKNISSGSGRLAVGQDLVVGRPFPEIEARIDELLDEAGTYLNSLHSRDLKPMINLHHQREVRRQRTERRQKGPE